MAEERKGLLLEEHEGIDDDDETPTPRRLDQGQQNSHLPQACAPHLRTQGETALRCAARMPITLAALLALAALRSLADKAACVQHPALCFSPNGHRLRPLAPDAELAGLAELEPLALPVVLAHCASEPSLAFLSKRLAQSHSVRALDAVSVADDAALVVCARGLSASPSASCSSTACLEAALSSASASRFRRVLCVLSAPVREDLWRSWVPSACSSLYELRAPS